MPTLNIERGGVTVPQPQWPLHLMERQREAESDGRKKIEEEAERIIKDRWEAVQSKPALAQMLSELEELLTDDNLESRPTLDALNRMKGLLSVAGDVLQEKFPYGYVMDDGMQGARVEWENRNVPVYLSLAIHAEPGNSDYLYYQGPDGKVLTPLVPFTLISALARFVDK